jgi:pimeloyl-ACP methyl ester carboxylesterase
VVPELAAHRFTLDTGRHELAVWEWGEGPTVLLVHGWGGLAADFRRLVKPLVDAGFSVVAFDGPAHGQSSGTHTTLLEHARAVEAVGRKMGPLEAVVGHSFGGAASAVALDRGLPARRAVFLASPMTMMHFARGAAHGLGLPERSHERWFEAVEARVGVPMASVDLRALGPRQTVPLLVVHDENDAEVPPDHGQGIVAAWPGARLVRTVGLGHRRILADPGVAELVVRTVHGDDVPAARLRHARGP